jgi:uncharacterized UPF0160 family protein
VPIESGSFTSRKALPAEWRGLRDVYEFVCCLNDSFNNILLHSALDAVTGVTGCVFVHANGFIGGARSREIGDARACARFTNRT